MKETFDAINSLLENKWVAFSLGSLCAPVLMKIVDYVLSQRASQRANQRQDTWQLLDSYRLEVERLNKENARLQELVRIKEEEIDDAWRDRRTLRDEMQVLILKVSEAEAKLAEMKLKVSP